MLKIEGLSHIEKKIVKIGIPGFICHNVNGLVHFNIRLEVLSPVRCQSWKFIGVSVKTPSFSSLRKHYISRLTVVPKNKYHCLCTGPITCSDVSSHLGLRLTYKHGRLARSNNQGDNKQKSSVVNRLQ